MPGGRRIVDATSQAKCETSGIRLDRSFAPAEIEIILCEDAMRRDKARLFVELTPEGLADLRHEIVERSIPSKKSWWGYDVIQIDDPDGNELLFPLSDLLPGSPLDERRWLCHAV